MEALRPAEAAAQRSLADAGLHLKPGWIYEALRAAPDGRTAGLAPEERAYQLALYSDLREAGTGCLPPGIEGFDNRTVEGKFVLQVDEIVDVSQAGEHRHGIINNRTLKMLLTDGVQSIVGMEKKRLSDLNVHSCAGLKIVVQNFRVRRGIAMLRPENCCILGGMEADLEKRRLKRIEDEERSRKRMQIVQDAEPEDEDRIHGSSSQMPSQQVPAHARPGNAAAPARPGGGAVRQNNAAAPLWRASGSRDDNDNRGAGMTGRRVSDGGGNSGAGARPQRHADEETGARAGRNAQGSAGNGRGGAVPSALAQAGDARRQPWSAGAAAVASADFSHGVGPRDRQQPPRAAAVGSGGSGGAGGGRVVEMEEDYDALLAADESDCIEDDPAYQLMLEEDIGEPPPVRAPPPAAPRPQPPPARSRAAISPSTSLPDRGGSGAEAIHRRGEAHLQRSSASMADGVEVGGGSCRADGDVQMSSAGDDDRVVEDGRAKQVARRLESEPVPCPRRQSEEGVAARALSVAAGPVKRSRDGNSNLLATPSPPQANSADSAHPRTADTGAGRLGEAGVSVRQACGDEGWQTLGEVRAMLNTGKLLTQGERTRVRIKGVCSSALKFYKSEFAVATELTDGIEMERVLLTRPVIESLLGVTSGQYASMSKEDKQKTSKNISEALTRTEGIFVIDISVAANTGRGLRFEEHTSPAGAANGTTTASPRTLLPPHSWHVVAIQPPTLADARWLLARAQRRLDHGS